MVIGLIRGGDRAARIVHSIGDKIPGVGGDRLSRIVLQASASVRTLATDRHVLFSALTWASLNWLLDAASLWCFIAAFGRFTNPVGLFAAYGIANVLGALPVSPAGLGVIDSVTPVLLVGFGLTRSVATLGVLAWRLVNFWLPIPAGAAAYISLKVPRGAGLAEMRRALADFIRPGRSARATGNGTPGDGQPGDDQRSAASQAGNSRPAGSGEPGAASGSPAGPDHAGGPQPVDGDRPGH